MAADPVSCYCGIMIQCRCNCRRKMKLNRKKPPVYILLLGAAETGKSTIMRQMKIIHNGEMTTDSLRAYKDHVLGNVTTCVYLLIDAVSASGLSWGSEEAKQAATILKEMKAITQGIAPENNTVSTNNCLDHAKLISTIWNDEAAQSCWGRANEFNLPDSTAYYLNSIDRISHTPFVPTQEDVLRLRLPTKAATVYDFTDKDWTFQITDVGGQRGERRRWIRLFDGIDAIIFLAALSEYDQFWRKEDEGGDGINRLELSLRLFKETVAFPGFCHATIILFLNKVDVFQQKILSSHLDQYFPNYQGLRYDYIQASKYICDTFLNQAESVSSRIGNSRRNIYPHETCATDTDKTKIVFTVVRDDILWNMLTTVFDPFP